MTKKYYMIGCVLAVAFGLTLFLAIATLEEESDVFYIDNVIIQEVKPDGTLSPDILEDPAIMSLYNYKTKKHDSVSVNWVGDLSPYVPQAPEIQMLYKMHVASGKSSIDAMLEVLNVVIYLLEEAKDRANNKVKI